VSFPLKDDALTIWSSGVEAVLPEPLVANRLGLAMAADGSAVVSVDGRPFALSPTARVIVVGMGKATGQMAAGAESALGALIPARRLGGWVNLPADAMPRLRAIHPHAGRPAGLNEPTEEGVYGARKMTELIESATPDDLILALISGGGSALAPLPIPEITLNEKALVTRLLSGSGANIEELNTVRKQLSLVKGGGMRRMARGKRLVALILSDVLGDPLDVIAGGATVENGTTAADALAVLRKFALDGRADLRNLCAVLEREASASAAAVSSPEGYENHRNIIVANTRRAVDAAVCKAKELGYKAQGVGALRCEGDVATVVETFLSVMNRTPPSFGPFAYVSGGEPTVTLAPPEIRGKGGRNTQLVLLTLIEALKNRSRFPAHFLVLSGGTDGEDGPTDAAGAFFDDLFVTKLLEEGPEVLTAAREAARRNDSYTFFAEKGGLLRSGATGTNVCDLRLLLFSAKVATENR
jgi:glycerate 2-kinase